MKDLGDDARKWVSHDHGLQAGRRVIGSVKWVHGWVTCLSGMTELQYGGIQEEAERKCLYQLGTSRRSQQSWRTMELLVASTELEISVPVK